MSEIDQNIPLKKETAYQKDLPPKIVKALRADINPLIRDEARILKEFGMRPYVNFSKLKKAKNGKVTAAYSLIVYRKEDLKKWHDAIGAELPQQQKQLKIAAKGRGGLSKREADQLLYAFYSLTPAYLRDTLNIKQNKWLSRDSKRRLLKSAPTKQVP